VNLRGEVSKALVNRGFRRDGRTHLLRVDKEFSLGVDTGPLGKRSDIAPFVGIRNDKVECLLTTLLDVPEDEWSWTVGANVGYVLGDGYQWWEPPAPPEDALRSIDAALTRLEEFLSLSELPKLWEEIQGTRDPSWRYRQIIILFLQGKRDMGLQALEESRQEFCKNEDEICDQFRGFEQRLKDISRENF